MNDSVPDRPELDPDDLDVLLRESIPAAVAALPAAVERIMDAVRDAGCAGSDDFEIELAVTEALANAVTHGCGGDPSKRVDVWVAFDLERALVIVVRDPGPGFDPACVPSPLAGRNLYSFHGRGVFLINRLMDDVRYERGGAEIWMRKRIHEGTTAEP